MTCDYHYETKFTPWLHILYSYCRTSHYNTHVIREDIATAAKINKKLTMHIARHIFGNISGERIPLQMLQKLYRHTSIATTIGYQGNFIHKDADAALNEVISF